MITSQSITIILTKKSKKMKTLTVILGILLFVLMGCKPAEDPCKANEIESNENPTVVIQ